jgi:hypothetical protein
MTAISAVLSPVATSDTEAAPSNKSLWGSRILTGISTAFLVFDAGVKLLEFTPALESSADLGWSPDSIFLLGVIEAVCLVLYLIPRTAVLGALLWTGYLGGAVATHVRIDNPLFSHSLFPIYVAALLWAALWLRGDARVRAFFRFTN